MSELKKRTYVYLHSPMRFGYAPCDCGNEDCQWSEFQNHVWCEKCKKDFIPRHFGIIDGPIAINIAHILGYNFDRMNLATQKVEWFDIESLKYIDNDGNEVKDEE